MVRFPRHLLATTVMSGIVLAAATAFNPASAQVNAVPAYDTSSESYAMPVEYLRQLVPYGGAERAGTIVIDPAGRHLYLIRDDGMAVRYGVGVGREGFEWSGRAQIKRKAEWPTWTPPADMRLRQPDLPISMAGGPENPLGARALYLFQGDRDTMYRIHGTNDPDSIGEAMSSGCIRMMNADVIDLYQRVSMGTPVVVLRQGQTIEGPQNDTISQADGLRPTMSAPRVTARSASLY